VTDLSPVEILLVEDNPNDAELALHGLQRFHLSNDVRVMTDGEEALDYLFCRGAFVERSVDLPRVVLLDLGLPRMNGMEVLREIRENPRTHELPVVIMTSAGEQRDIDAGLAGGANSFIVKPVDFHQLADAVRPFGLHWLLVKEPPGGS